MGQGPGPTSIPGRSTWAHSVLYQPHLQGFWTQVCSRSRHEVPGEESPFASSRGTQTGWLAGVCVSMYGCREKEIGKGVWA